MHNSHKCCIFAPAKPTQGCSRCVSLYRGANATGWDLRTCIYIKASNHALFWRIESRKFNFKSKQCNDGCPEGVYILVIHLSYMGGLYLLVARMDVGVYISAWASRCLFYLKGNARARSAEQATAKSAFLFTDNNRLRHVGVKTLTCFFASNTLLIVLHDI